MMVGLENLVLGAFRLVYKRKRPRALGDKRPRLAWFPKYQAGVELPEEVLDSDDPDDALAARLEPLGFRLDSWTPDRIRFTRGKAWGDFSVKLVKLDLSLPHPLERTTSLQLEVAGVCAFDTGDLWNVCRQAVALIEARDALSPG